MADEDVGTYAIAMRTDRRRPVVPRGRCPGGDSVTWADMDDQPADVRFVTDQIVSPTDPLAARVDGSRVAVAGHSDGAVTALAASTDPVPAGEPRYRAVLVLSGQTG